MFTEDPDNQPSRAGLARPAQNTSAQRKSIVTFHRKELTTILGTYGMGVANGEWRDYAIDYLSDAAVFSIFRRSAEFPIYRIEKRPKLAQRQGAFQILSPSGQILKRGHDLKTVLRFLDRKLFKVVESSV